MRQSWTTIAVYNQTKLPPTWSTAFFIVLLNWIFGHFNLQMFREELCRPTFTEFLEIDFFQLIIFSGLIKRVIFYDSWNCSGDCFIEVQESCKRNGQLLVIWNGYLGLLLNLSLLEARNLVEISIFEEFFNFISLKLRFIFNSSINLIKIVENLFETASFSRLSFQIIVQ